MHLVHRDRNYIYNFWPREGEIIALAWGRLNSMLCSCPNHELSREISIQNFYARLSRNDQTMLDTSCAGYFRRLLNSGGIFWKELNATLKIGNSAGKESGMTPKFDCVKSFMDTDIFRKFSTKYGLDSEIVASFCESFAT